MKTQKMKISYCIPAPVFLLLGLACPVLNLALNFAGYNLEPLQHLQAGMLSILGFFAGLFSFAIYSR